MRIGPPASRAGLALLTAAILSCAPRLRVDRDGIRPVESIAPITFIGNRIVRPPVRAGQVSPPMPTDPTLATAASVFRLGIPAFYDALRSGDRFRIVPASAVLEAVAYREFPAQLTGVNASTAQLAEGWRLVTPDDGRKIADLLREIDADAALLTYWRFSLDPHTTGIGVDTAHPRVYLRAWLVDRNGRVIADDEFNVLADTIVGVYGQRYDGRAAAGMYSDPIETCAVRLIADLSNARNDARAEAARKPPALSPEATPISAPEPALPAPESTPASAPEPALPAPESTPVSAPEHSPAPTP